MLKVNEKVRFFPNKQGTGQLTWLTGTVNEILDCGHSYTIKGPNGRVYRRNRAHLKPICYDGSTFQARTTADKDKKPKSDSFQDPKPLKKMKTVSFQTDTTDVMARAITLDKQDEHPVHSPSHHSPSHSSKHHHHSPSTPSQPSPVEPKAEASTHRGRERHNSVPTFIRPQDVNSRLTPQLAALLELTSPLVLQRHLTPGTLQEREISQIQSHGSIYELMLIHF